MKNHRLCIAALLLVFLVPFSGETLETKNLRIAVSPFESSIGDEQQEYIGFQISEYLTSALATFPEITVIERGKLKEVIREQKLTLSGLTTKDTAAEIGNLIQAKQLLVGSFTLTDKALSVSGRIVDTSTGKVLSAAQVDGYYNGNITPVLKPFFYKILGKEAPEQLFSEMSALEQRLSALESERDKGGSNQQVTQLQEKISSLEDRQKELESALQSMQVSIDVEAKLSLLENDSAETSVEYAKAIQASFSGEKKAAVNYLEGIVGNPSENIMGYGKAADDYFREYSALEGSSFYAQILKKQLQLNKDLSTEAQNLSEYRSTLKLFTHRMRSIMDPHMFEIQVERKEDVDIGRSSAVVTIPSDITVSVRERYRRMMNNLLSSQSTVSLEAEYLKAANPPLVKKILPYGGIQNLFQIHFTSRIGHSIQFLDKEGSVLFQLDSESYEPFRLSGVEKERWQHVYKGGYTVALPREGWKYSNGKVTIQARELRHLSSIRTVMQKDRYRGEYKFPAYSDTKWKSILMHGFRSSYLKPAVEGADDPMPSVKDIVITHSLFSIPDYIENVPLLVDQSCLSGAADPTAVVYWGDDSSTTVSGSWTGVISGESRDHVGDFSSETVLYFPITNKLSLHSGEGQFTVSVPGASKSSTFHICNGRSWVRESKDPGCLLYHEGNLYVGTESSSGKNYRITPDGKTIIWERKAEDARASRGMLVHDDFLLFDFYYPYGSRRPAWMSCLDKNTGETLWIDHRFRKKRSMVASEGTLFVPNFPNMTIYSIDIASGDTLWRKHDAENLLLSDELLYGRTRSRIFCLNKDTGAQIWETRIDTDSFAVYKGRIFSTDKKDGTFCLDALSGEVVWRKRQIEGVHIEFTNHALIVSTSRDVWRLDTKTGAVLWHYEETGGTVVNTKKSLYSDFLIMDAKDRVYALDYESGECVWNNSGLDSVEAVGSSFLFHASDKQVVAVDLRTLHPWYQLTQQGDKAFEKKEFEQAFELYHAAIREEGCEDGLVLFRTARCLEEVEGLSPKAIMLYREALRSLKIQYPSHEYIEIARENSTRKNSGSGN